MTLLGFVTQLLQSGSVTLGTSLAPFAATDLTATADLLGKYHRWDALHMPLTVPAFDPHAAVWAAQYICRALQFLMLRNLGEELMADALKPYDQAIDAEATYSADLCLRYLPTVYDMAKSLSPSDPLVTNMAQTAAKWPFSAVGMGVEGKLDGVHPSLDIAYADRVLASKDRKLSRQATVNLQLQAALGAHGKRLWADFEPMNLEDKDDARTTEQ
jgi:hypothetical protein